MWFISRSLLANLGTRRLLVRCWWRSHSLGRSTLVLRLLILSIWRRIVWLLRRGIFADNLTLGEWLTVCAIQLLRNSALVSPHCMCGNKGLSLGTNRCEHTLLRKALAVGAATVLGLVESRASDLNCHCVSERDCERGTRRHSRPKLCGYHLLTDLASSAVPACNRSALARGGLSRVWHWCLLVLRRSVHLMWRR